VFGEAQKGTRHVAQNVRGDRCHVPFGLCRVLRSQRTNATVVEAACGATTQIGTLYVADGIASRSTLCPEMLPRTSCVRKVIQVPVRTVDSIVQEANLERVDFVLIGVEGFQLEVLKGFTLSRVKPRLMIVEDHLRDYKTHLHMTRGGCRLVKRVARNNGYVPNDARFDLAGPLERLNLHRRLWLNTPFRAIKRAVR